MLPFFDTLEPIIEKIKINRCLENASKESDPGDVIDALPIDVYPVNPVQNIEEAVKPQSRHVVPSDNLDLFPK